jgi:hypothetical protein
MTASVLQGIKKRSDGVCQTSEKAPAPMFILPERMKEMKVAFQQIEGRFMG